MQGWARFCFLVTGVLGMAACGGGGSGGTLTPPPPPPPPPAAPSVDVQRVFPNLPAFLQPVSMVQAPGDATRWYVVGKSGVVQVFDNDPAVNSADVFVNIAGRVDSNPNEAGLLGIAFHPSYPSTPEVYLSYTANVGGLLSRVSRFTLDALNPDVLDPNSEEILFVIQQPQGNHNGGDLAFGPDGNLYASFGDGGGAGDPQENAQNRRNLLGTIVRIDVDGNSPYEIPPDNPFFGNNLCVTGQGGADCPEIYAWGLRNPWRISFDSASGALWIGDVGQGAWEEIDRADASQAALDRNFGWNDREGAHCFEPPNGCSTNSLDPVTEYGRSLGASVTGGYVYRGSAIPSLVGFYVFGDFISGRLFAVAADAQPTTAPVELIDTTLSISTFAEDANGELYVIDYVGGTVHQVTAAP
ncbi:MAG: PQQ-dependent sugar dehydrogenase [Woeseiaceae bacterium]|nr:PQQ-dependent sugar dehydrogenase [Woeseiaceae bacterium]